MLWMHLVEGGGRADTLANVWIEVVHGLHGEKVRMIFFLDLCLWSWILTIQLLLVIELLIIELCTLLASVEHVLLPI